MTTPDPIETVLRSLLTRINVRLATQLPCDDAFQRGYMLAMRQTRAMVERELADLPRDTEEAA